MTRRVSITPYKSNAAGPVVLPLSELQSKCYGILDILMAHRYAREFNKPIDPDTLGLTDYYVMIKKPMDLETVRENVKSGVYYKLEQFERDVLLTFDNAMYYSRVGSVVYPKAKVMKEKFQHHYARLIQEISRERRGVRYFY